MYLLFKSAFNEKNVVQSKIQTHVAFEITLLVNTLKIIYAAQLKRENKIHKNFKNQHFYKAIFYIIDYLDKVVVENNHIYQQNLDLQ